MTDDKVRAAAEREYSVTAFDYARDPVGSRDWTLYWKGYQAGRAAAQEWRPMKEAKMGERVLVKFHDGFSEIHKITDYLKKIATGWMYVPGEAP